MPSSVRWTVVACLGFCAGLAAQEIPSPESRFGFRPGTDRELANWTRLSAYYDELAAASPRVSVDTIGPTTDGRPFVMLTVTSPENHARLDELRDVQLRLADPRRVADEVELERLLEVGRTVVLVTHAIHSTEVGSAQTAANLLYRLASSQEPRVLEILDNVILLDVPSLNPDGTEWVVDWYNEHVGTRFEGAALPWLYHRYVGHDNNRDWYAFTQVETQHAILGAHNAWHPQIVHDIHQMGGTGARMFVPPYIDPIEHNVDHAITTAVNMLGTYMAARLTAEGKQGIVVNAIYDGYTPARAYQHYHAGARILSETASARLASPRRVDPEEIGGGREYDAAVPSWNYPDPWRGGVWGLPDIVAYMEAGAMALLTHAARNRRLWLENFFRINQRAVRGWDAWPDAWVIPAQDNRVGLAYVLRILRMGDVEVHRTTRALSVSGRTVPEGSYVVPMTQPYAAFAQTLLEVQRYPDLREYPGGPPRRPYDVTAHTLGLLMGVETFPVEDAPDALLASLEGSPISTPDFAFEAPGFLTGPDAPRVALYKSWQEPMESGWTRWVLDQHGIAYDTLKDARVRSGGLARNYDVILLQDQDPASIAAGYAPGTMPPAYTGGLGPEGGAALAAFVRDGGRIVAVEQAADYVVDLLGLGVRNAVADLDSRDFFVPGSILGVGLASGHPINRGLGASRNVWYWSSSRAWVVEDPEARVVATYAGGNPVRSGWILGPEHLAGRPAVVEVPVGRGSVVLFGFQPNYRAQTVATWPMLFNALDARSRPGA